MTDHPEAHRTTGKNRSTAVLDVSGMQWASEQNVLASVLRRRASVLEVAMNRSRRRRW